MISSDVIRGYNDTIILYLLQQNPSYGYEISKKIRMISEEKYIIKETTLYSAFTRMEKMGTLNRFPAMRQEVSGARIIVSPKKENCIMKKSVKSGK